MVQTAALVIFELFCEDLHTGVWQALASTSHALSELFHVITDEPLMAPIGAYDPQYLVSEDCPGVHAQHDRPSTAWCSIVMS